MAAEFRSSNEPLSAADLGAVERRLVVELPESYKALMLHANGGRPVNPDQRVFKTGDGTTILNHFYPIGETDLLAELEPGAVLAWRHGTMHPDLLAVGACDGGNEICIDVADAEQEKYGCVYYFVSDELPEGHENLHTVKPWAKMKGFRKIADSFAELLESMGLGEIIGS